jgi:hypothetical protein
MDIIRCLVGKRAAIISIHTRMIRSKTKRRANGQGVDKTETGSGARR